jgi:alkanesulfonate monooxygenase SsuD/methylene tetrahydromethanopterin reductase-like flavin-dependent oxidoreductase (luciferase family)
LPGIGITRHIVVAETDDAARAIAAAAYPRWRDAIEFLWRRTNADFVLKDVYPRDFAALERIGHGIAGSPATVRDYLVRLQEETGVNSVLCQMVFGDMRFEDAARSIGLFGREIIPAFS